MHLGQLAIAYAHLDQPETAIGLLDEALVTSEKTQERLFDAELHQRRGDVFLIFGNVTQAEIALGEALTVARAQNARLWELRAATVWPGFGGNSVGTSRPAARDLLEPLYGWFTEGFDTPDLRRARALLNELR